MGNTLAKLKQVKFKSDCCNENTISFTKYVVIKCPNCGSHSKIPVGLNPALGSIADNTAILDDAKKIS